MMANPRPEPFLKLSKELCRAVVLAPFGGVQLSIILATMSKTDYDSKPAPISVGLLASMTGRDKGQVSRSLRRLVDEGVIRREDGKWDHTSQMLSVNSDYESWGKYSVPLQTVDSPSTVAPEQQLPTRNTTVDGESTQQLLQSNCCVAPEQPLKTKRLYKTSSKTEKTVPDLFDDVFWSTWPNHHGSKQLAAKRFHALTEPQQQRCIAACGHLVAAIDDGRLDVQFQPRAENFVGGVKTYYIEWVDGPPARYRNIGRSHGVSAEEIFNAASAAETPSLEAPDEAQ
jgi:hypothetical protein